MQTKANQQDHNLLTYTALEQLGLSGTVTMDQACAALPRDSILQLGNSINFENRITDVTGKYVEITITNARGYIHCTEYDTSSKIWYQGWYPPFSGWVPIATAMPPEVHDLMLGEGIQSSSYYFKQQDSVLGGHIAFTPTAAILTGTVIATLPPGYRPNRAVNVFLDASINGHASLTFATNGDIKMWVTGVSSMPAGTPCKAEIPAVIAI